MITINDRDSILSASGRNDLATYPTKYNAVVELNSQYVTTPALVQAAHNCVTAPNKICIFIDPQHHHVAVRFGTDTGVAPANFDMVSKAGNSEFHAGDWVNGVKSILSRAEVTSTKSNQPTAVIVQQPVVERPMPVWPWLVGIGVMAALGWAIIAVVRRRTSRLIDEADKMSSEAGELAQRNVERMASNDFDSALRNRVLEADKKKAFESFQSQPVLPQDNHGPTGSYTPTGATGTTGPMRPFRSHTPAPITIRNATPVSVSVPAKAKTTHVHHHHHDRTPAPVVIASQQSPGLSLGDVLIANAIINSASDRREERYEHRRHRTPTPAPRSRTPEPSVFASSRSYDSGGSSSSSDDSDSGGGSSSFDSDSGGSCDSGGGSSDF